MRLSVVIPTRNEAAGLRATLAAARAVPEVHEVVVSDGGSTDATRDIAREAGARVLQGPAGRGGQLRRGAGEATGDVVVLVHADTHLPPDAGHAIRKVLSDPAVVGGGFRKAFRDGPMLLRRGAVWRSILFTRLTGRFFGDQALFIRRDALRAAGGVPEFPLMEEFELARRLKAHGRLALAPSTVTTSGRRFAEHGLLRTWWLMAGIGFAYWRGASPEALHRRYHAVRRPAGSIPGAD